MDAVPPSQPPVQPPGQPPGQRPGDDQQAKLWRISGMGIELVGAIAGMTLGGYLLDTWWNTSPIGLLTGLVLGFVGGGYNFIRRALAESKQETERFRREHPAGVKRTRPRRGGREGKGDDA